MKARSLEIGDASEVHALVVAYDTALAGHSEETIDEITRWLADLDLDRDGWAVEIDDGIVGVVGVERDGEGFEIDGYVHPRAWGRGVGTLLLDLAEARVRAMAPGARVRTAHLAGDSRAQALLASRSYRKVRSFFRMTVTHDEEPARPTWPAETRVTDLHPEDAADLVHGAVEEAFADHWGFEPRPFQEWRSRFLEPPRCVPSLTVLAWQGEHLVGVAINGVRGEAGFVSQLGVRPAWRRGGLGLALLRESFHRAWRHDLPTVALGVDAENASGALALYERAGMTVSWQADVWEKKTE